jgi:outer membrane protein assembly factor BamA
MKRTLFLLLSALVLFAATLPAAAQKFQPRTIQFKGAPEYSDEELLAAAGLKIGAVLTSSEMKSHGQKLQDTGLFESFSFAFNGVDLVYTLVPSSILYPVRLENLPFTPGKELDAALRSRVPLYRGKVPYEAGLTEQVRQALEEMLAARGIQATIVATPYTDEKLVQVTAMSYSITDPAVRVGEIHLEGVSPEMQADVKTHATITMHTKYNTENTMSNIEHEFASLYADEGYSSAKVHAVQSGNPVIGSKAIDIPFNVTIEEGPHNRLGSIYLPSGELLTQEMINKTAGLVTNKVETSLSVKGGVTLEKALHFVTGQYKSKGYLDCVVTPHPQHDEAAGVVNYTLEVEPGPVYTMGKLTIQNSADDLRAAMLAAWKLPEGAVFSESALQTYYSAQGNTMLGRTFASAICKYKLTKNIETHVVDVTLRLERKN